MPHYPQRLQSIISTNVIFSYIITKQPSKIIHDYHLIGSIQVSTIVSVMPFVAIEFNPRSYVAFSCELQSGIVVPQSFLDFQYLTSLKAIVQLLCKIFLSRAFLMFPNDQMQVLHFWKNDHSSNAVCFSLHFIKWYTISICPITSDS